MPNAPGVENGTRDNFLASGTEDFDEDSVNIRIDGRLSDSTNLFGRYSIGDFLRDGATAFGAAGGEELVSLGGVSTATNQSLALGVDRTFSPTVLADVRFGWFRYNVDVLPFDHGTTPAADAGIPGLNLDTALTSSMPAMFITGGPGIELGSALGVNRCNCPLDQEEDQWQIVGNVIKIWGDHTIKLGADVRRAHNLRLPSDRHRSGELTFDGQRTAGPGGVGGLGLASLLLGEVTRFTRYFNEEVNARERQWRQFYYVQDTWRPSPKWTFNYGIRLDVIHPQSVNAAGNGGWLDLDTGDVRVGGVGGVGYNAVQAKLEQRFSQGFTYRVAYTLQRATGEGDSYFFWDRDLDEGPNDFDRTQNLIVSTVAELPIGRNRRFGADMSPFTDALVGGWQVNMNYTYSSGRPFNVSYRGAGADRDVGPNRPDLIGDPDGPKTRDEWFNATPIGSPDTAFGRPEPGTFGTLGRNELCGPSLWQVDASLFKNVRLGGNRQLQIRIEATNLFNHVNLGQPDATVGVPGDDNPNAGRINSTAGPQRFFQLGLRFAF